MNITQIVKDWESGMLDAEITEKHRVTPEQVLAIYVYNQILDDDTMYERLERLHAGMSFSEICQEMNGT